MANIGKRRVQVRLGALALNNLKDVLWSNPPNVLGLPCVCATPELHSGECVRVRMLANSVISWKERNTMKEEVE